MKEKNKNINQSSHKKWQEDNQNSHASTLNNEILNFLDLRENRDAMTFYYGKEILTVKGHISMSKAKEILIKESDGSIVIFFELCDKITNEYLNYKNIDWVVNNDEYTDTKTNQKQNKILNWQKEIQEISSRYLKEEIKNFMDKKKNRDAIELYFGEKVHTRIGTISIARSVKVLTESSDGSIVAFLEICDKITNNYLNHINIESDLIKEISEYLSIKINRKAIINYFGKDVLDNREYFNIEMATKILNREANGSIEKLQSIIDKVNHEYSKVSTYQEQIKHPLWKKKRLEIFDRDDWKCAKCGCEGKPLHLHHKKYITGLKAWEYENKDLITLCEDCHFKEHDESIMD